jgi:hypothetical protein
VCVNQSQIEGAAWALPEPSDTFTLHGMASPKRAISSLMWWVFDRFTRTPAQSKKTLMRIRPLLRVWFAVADVFSRLQSLLRRKSH